MNRTFTCCWKDRFGTFIRQKLTHCYDYFGDRAARVKNFREVARLNPKLLRRFK